MLLHYFRTEVSITLGPFNSFLKIDISFFQLGVLLDRRVFFYILPVLSFVLMYSKLPHKVLFSSSVIELYSL